MHSTKTSLMNPKSQRKTALTPENPQDIITSGPAITNWNASLWHASCGHFRFINDLKVELRYIEWILVRYAFSLPSVDCLANRFATLIGVDLNPGSSAQLYSLALATFSADVSSERESRGETVRELLFMMPTRSRWNELIGAIASLWFIQSAITDCFILRLKSSVPTRPMNLSITASVVRGP